MIKFKLTCIPLPNVINTGETGLAGRTRLVWLTGNNKLPESIWHLVVGGKKENVEVEVAEVCLADKFLGGKARMVLDKKVMKVIAFSIFDWYWDR